MADGFILGAFAPLHAGHIFFIEQSLKACERVHIFLYSAPDDSIPGWQRYHWLKSTFPALDIRHWELTVEAAAAIRAQNRLPADMVAAVQALEATSWMESGFSQQALAVAVGLEHWALDAQRIHFPVKTVEIEQNPLLFWDLLPKVLRPFYLKRVVLVGPESCGKSYLATQLAQHFDTVFVEEYGRTYCEKFGMDSTELDFAHVASGQLFREDEMALEANRLLFCDTDLIVTQIWSEIYFSGKCQPWIVWANHARHYDLFLLCAPDIPWVNDGLREFEHQRNWMFERLKQELDSRQKNYQIIQGPLEGRLPQAVEAVTALLG